METTMQATWGIGTQFKGALLSLKQGKVPVTAKHPLKHATKIWRFRTGFLVRQEVEEGAKKAEKRERERAAWNFLKN